MFEMRDMKVKLQARVTDIFYLNHLAFRTFCIKCIVYLFTLFRIILTRWKNLKKNIEDIPGPSTLHIDHKLLLHGIGHPIQKILSLQ